MRKLFLLALLLPGFLVQGQNLQMMYGFGEGNKHITTTLEMFRPDDWGNTFFFVDIEFNNGPQRHPSTAYMEIARCLRFWEAPLSLHLEYNGGLLTSADGYGFPINNAWLGGVDYEWSNKNFSKILNLKLLYKNIVGINPYSFQITGVWNLNYFRDKLTLAGFADFWMEDNSFYVMGSSYIPDIYETSFIFMTEPQAWYNINKHLALGGEVRIAHNFGTVQGLKVSPRLGVKWSF